MERFISFFTKFAVIIAVIALTCAALYYSFVVSMERQTSRFETDALTVAASYRSAMDVVDGIATSLNAGQVVRSESQATYTQHALEQNEARKAESKAEAMQDSFAKTLMLKYPFIDGFGRYKKVSGSTEEESLPAQDVVYSAGSTAIWQYDNNGDRVIAESREDEGSLYPVTSIISPVSRSDENGTAITGFDLGSVPAIDTAVQRASEFGQIEVVKAPDRWPNPGNVLTLKGLYRGGVMPEKFGERGEAAIGGYWLEIDFGALGPQKELVEERGMGLSFMQVDPGAEFEAASVTRLHHRDMSETGLLFSGWLQPDVWVGSFRVSERTYTIRLSQQRGMTIFSFLVWLFAVIGVLAALTAIGLLNANRIKAVKRQRQQSEALFLEQQREAVTLLHISDAVIRTDIDEQVEYVNKAAAEMLEVSAKTIIGQPIQSIFREPSDRHVERDAAWDDEDIYRTEDAVSRDRYLRRLDGSTISVSETVSPVLDAENRRTGSVVVLRDVTAEKELTRQLEHQINHDPLTGLANRLNFEGRMNLLLAEDAAGRFNHALCLIDLDRFKQVNDTCGHQAGDKLLLELSGALSARIRSEDLLARLGGDEFAVLIEHCDLESARSIANRLHQFFNSYHFEYDNKVFPVRASIGLVHFDPAEVDVKQVTLAADAACYKAKSSGRNAVHVYSDANEAIGESKGEMLWLPRLEHAIANDGFVLHAQPLGEFDNGKLVEPGFFELLMRMKDDESESALIYPLQFLKSAQRYGLMREIDDWVINSALATIASLPREYSSDIFSINLSAATLEREDFYQFLANQLNDSQVTPSRICFEFTEESVLNNFESAKSAIASMNRLGCKVALDNFGAGVSSLSSLRELRLDYLKIDGQFIDDIENSFVNESMVRSIHNFASTMGLKTIAQAVESKEACEQLSEIGVDYIQGFVIARPAPLMDFGNAAKAA